MITFTSVFKIFPKTTVEVGIITKQKPVSDNVTE